MMKRGMVFVSMSLLAGCSARIVPPPATGEMLPVAITDYGRHSSLVLPDEKGRGSVEFAFGDWNWFAAGKNSPGDAVIALFASAGATLGRMDWPLPPDSPDLAARLQANKVLVISAPADRVVALRQRLEDRFNARSSAKVYNETMKLWFVPDDEPYRLWHNCNHVTARWLEALGCRIRGWPYLSKFRLVPPAQKAPPAQKESEPVAALP